MQGTAGQATVFLVVLLPALLVLAGLVYDGGLILAAKRRAGAEADAAARAAAQALSVEAYRRGEGIRLDPDEASAAAAAYLAQYGHEVEQVVVQGDSATVSVRVPQDLVLLGAVGARTVTVEGTGRARLATTVEKSK